MKIAIILQGKHINKNIRSNCCRNCVYSLFIAIPLMSKSKVMIIKKKLQIIMRSIK